MGRENIGCLQKPISRLLPTPLKVVSLTSGTCSDVVNPMFLQVFITTGIVLTPGLILVAQFIEVTCSTSNKIKDKNSISPYRPKSWWGFFMFENPCAPCFTSHYQHFIHSITLWNEKKFVSKQSSFFQWMNSTPVQNVQNSFSFCLFSTKLVLKFLMVSLKYNC